MLQRKEIRFLEDWATSRPRKPLVIRGARQVGKSTLVREFARSARMPLVEVNFERNPELREAFSARDPDRILSTLYLLTGKHAVAGTSLLFLDEIQAAPEALSALRYFYEEIPELHVVAAGSLIDFALADARFPMPVGRVEYLHMGPMEFEDFLAAMGRSELVTYLSGYSFSETGNDGVPKALHRKLLELLRQYWIVGGLPEAISHFSQTEEGTAERFNRVARIQQSVVAAYRDDFNKYSHGSLRDRIGLVFDRLPAMVGRKFKYVNVSRLHRARRTFKCVTAPLYGARGLQGSPHGRQRRATGSRSQRALFQMPVHGRRPHVRRLASECTRSGKRRHDAREPGGRCRAVYWPALAIRGASFRNHRRFTIGLAKPETPLPKSIT